MKFLFRLLVFTAIAWMAGFIWFISALPRQGDISVPTDQEMGIIALTGGSGRIEMALNLLAQHPDAKMLISGVHADTKKAELAARLPEYAALFDCCVEIGKRALTTKGNALEASEWSKANQLETIIIVTTDYHMPRAMSEIRFKMPEAHIIAWPVASPAVPAQGWITSPEAIKILAFEYTKFIFVEIAHRLSLS
ncbi:MAG: YdcF family protein [bacterium]